ncbi:hypothetical protein SDJN03_02922, partial [Cucurbita argyrosperma subsp. sororia]
MLVMRRVLIFSSSGSTGSSFGPGTVLASIVINGFEFSIDMSTLGWCAARAASESSLPSSHGFLGLVLRLNFLFSLVEYGR